MGQSLRNRFRLGALGKSGCLARGKHVPATARLAVVALVLICLPLASAIGATRNATVPYTDVISTVAYQGGDGVQVNADITPNGSDTDVHVEWGPTTALGNVTAATTVPAYASDEVIELVFPGLLEQTSYFEVVAVNRSGTTTTPMSAFFLGGSQPRATVHVKLSGVGVVTSAPGGFNCGSVCDASFTGNTPVTLYATAPAGGQFLGWGDPCPRTSPDCTITPTAGNYAQTVVAFFTQQRQPPTGSATLAITSDGLGSGMVTASGGSVSGGTASCTVTTAHQPCTVTFTSSRAVGTLAAIAATGSTFVGWSGACTGTTNCSLNFSGSATVNATFARRPFEIKVVTDGGAHGRVVSDPPAIDCGPTCAATFPGGSSVTLHATAVPGWTFGNWTGACSGTTPTCVVSPPTSTTVGATFVPLPNLTVSASGTGTGTVASTPGGIDCGQTCVAPFSGGTSVTLQAVASAGSAFAGWSGACSGTTTACTITLTADTTVGAEFTILPTLTVATAGAGRGSITGDSAEIDCPTMCSGTFALAAHVTLTARPYAGSRFTGWSGACASAPTSQCTLDLAGAVSVTATFALVPASCVVPQLHAKTIAAAKAALAAAHCSLGAVAKRVAPSSLIGRVVSQAPPARRRLPHAARVNVTVGVSRR
jgi:hypothetical protein